MVRAQRARSAAHRCSLVLLLVALVYISAVDVIAIRDPFVFAGDAALLLSYVGLLGGGVVLLVVSTTPWRYSGRLTTEVNGYWFDDHRWLGGLLVALLLVAFGVGLLFGMAKGIGGNYSYFQLGRHYFETGGDCSHCPRWMISRSTYVTKVRAVGITESFFFQWIALFAIYFAVPLRPLADGDVPGWILAAE